MGIILLAALGYALLIWLVGNSGLGGASMSESPNPVIRESYENALFVLLCTGLVCVILIANVAQKSRKFQQKPRSRPDKKRGWVLPS